MKVKVQTDAGEIFSGRIILYFPSLQIADGMTETIICKDENGVPFLISGEILEILKEGEQ